jgi:hypothetical protein
MNNLEEKRREEKRREEETASNASLQSLKAHPLPPSGFYNFLTSGRPRV